VTETFARPGTFRSARQGYATLLAIHYNDGLGKAPSLAPLRWTKEESAAVCNNILAVLQLFHTTMA